LSWMEVARIMPDIIAVSLLPQRQSASQRAPSSPDPAF